MLRFNLGIGMFDPLQMPLSGVHSIAASAGTGKTFTITTLYLRLLLEGGCSTDQILVTTFTEAATSELRDRLRSRLNDALQLLRSFPEHADAEGAVKLGQANGQFVQLLEQGGAWDKNSTSSVIERIEGALLSFDQAPVFERGGEVGKGRENRLSNLVTVPLVRLRDQRDTSRSGIGN